MIDFETLGELSKALDGAWGHAVGTRDQPGRGEPEHFPGSTGGTATSASDSDCTQQAARKPARSTPVAAQPEMTIAAGQEVELRFGFDINEVMRALYRRGP
jgi:hypothetical protein